MDGLQVRATSAPWWTLDEIQWGVNLPLPEEVVLLTYQLQAYRANKLFWY